MHELSTIAGNLNYILIAIAFAMRNILYLRILTIFSSICAIYYYSYHLATPLWIGVSWEIVFISINIIQVIIIFYEKRRINFSEDEQEIYEKIFPHLLPSQYKKLMKISTFAQAEKGEVLIEQGIKVPFLILIYKGMTCITINGKTVNYCGPGRLLGEMSFLSDEPATATVQAIQPTKYISWYQQDLRKLLNNNPDIMTGMQAVFNKDFIKKLTQPLSEEEHI